MRKINQNIDFIKSKIKILIGIEMDFTINRGRNKLEYYQGQIVSAFPSIFTVNFLLPDGENKLEAFSYNDILTRSIKMTYREAESKDKSITNTDKGN